MLGRWPEAVESFPGLFPGFGQDADRVAVFRRQFHQVLRRRLNFTPAICWGMMTADLDLA